MTTEETIEVRSEAELIDTARRAITHAELEVSHSGWVVGECAADWCEAWAKGRTYADFGSRIGMSGDQVSARVRVWNTFGDNRDSYLVLSWSHFNVALAWDDALACLGWADENQATVAEMTTWRRLQHGDDLSLDVETERRISDLKSQIAELSEKPLQEGFDDPVLRGSAPSREESMASLSDRDPSETEYAPFRVGGGSTGERPTKQAPNVTGSVDQSRKLVRGLATSVKRLVGSNESLRYAIADQLVAISDQLRAVEDVTGLESITLDAVIRQAGAA